MSVPMNHLEIEKEVTLSERDRQRYETSFKEYGPPKIEGSHINPTQKLIFELRDAYDMLAVEHVEISPQGIMRYIF